MAGQEFRPRSFHPQAWARPLFLPETKSPNKSEVTPVPHGAPWSWIKQSSLYPSLFLVCPIGPRPHRRALPHTLGLRCNEQIGAPEGVGANRAVRVSLRLPPPEEGKSGSPN